MRLTSAFRFRLDQLLNSTLPGAVNRFSMSLTTPSLIKVPIHGYLYTQLKHNQLTSVRVLKSLFGVPV